MYSTEAHIRTIVCIPLTGNLDQAESPENLLLPPRSTGVPKDSVASRPQIFAGRSLAPSRARGASRNRSSVSGHRYRLGAVTQFSGREKIVIACAGSLVMFHLLPLHFLS